MSALYWDPGPRSQDFASGETPDLPLDKYITIHQSNMAKALRVTRCSSAVVSLMLAALLAAAPKVVVAQNVQADSSASARRCNRARSEDAAAFP
jgi:hypothetical protein